MGYDVFISYSRRDYVDEHKQIIPDNIISKIRNLFDANNISYWFDEEGVFSGDAFAPAIARNIKSSKIFLFISSENSNKSEWTSNEIATAHSYNKKIIPFRYDNSVYNDSVIMYIAKLDYIEHLSNPSKSLPRLLLSIQNYLREEKEKCERERQEEERRRHAEISRQERTTKLQIIRKKIETLETRKFNIEKDILTQEKFLSDMRNERRILEANIADLQEEEALLLGNSSRRQVVEEANERHNATHIEEKTSHPNFFVREWRELKQAMTLRHWITNGVLIIGFVIAAIFSLIFLTRACYYGNDTIVSAHLALSLAGYIGFISFFSLLKNCKTGIIGVCTSLVSANIIAIVTYCRTYINWEEEFHGTTLDYWIRIQGFDDLDALVPFLSIIAFILLLSSLFIRKNGRSTWSQLKKFSTNWKSDKIFITSILFFIMMVVSVICNWTY